MRWKRRSPPSRRARSRWSLSCWRCAMSNGTVESIHIASVAEGPPKSVAQATAVPGAGLDGDRYALKLGTFYKPAPDHELTLIEAEAIEALRRDFHAGPSLGDPRPHPLTPNPPPHPLSWNDFSISHG